MTQKTFDITELLFEEEKLTPEEQRIEDRKQELYNMAGEEALERLANQMPFSPLRLLNALDEIYRTNLARENLPYDEERGF
jgi:hypothetical protein